MMYREFTAQLENYLLYLEFDTSAVCILKMYHPRVLHNCELNRDEHFLLLRFSFL